MSICTHRLRILVVCKCGKSKRKQRLEDQAVVLAVPGFLAVYYDMICTRVVCVATHTYRGIVNLSDLSNQFGKLSFKCSVKDIL